MGKRDVVVLVLGDLVDCTAVAELCERLSALIDGRDLVEHVVCDMAGVARPDAGTLEVLARLQLTAQRRGSQVRLRSAGRDVQELLALAGMDRLVQSDAGQSSRVAGSPNSVNNRGSRNCVSWTIRPPETSMTWTDHGSCRPR